MPKVSAEFTEKRREEILTACAKLYETKSFHEITIKEIGESVSVTRTSLYNYFNTKEEIFLALLEREFNQWAEQLEKLLHMRRDVETKKLAKLLTKTLKHRKMLLKLSYLNHADIEEHSRLEHIVCMKRAYKKAVETMDAVLQKFYPTWQKEDRDHFLYSFLPFLLGVYPYTEATEKQKEAIRAADINFHTLPACKTILQTIDCLLAGCESLRQKRINKPPAIDIDNKLPANE